MTGQKRCCATCSFFQDMDLSGNGWCTHPKRKVSSDVKILVRKGELACRNSWGGDYWADAKHTAAVDSPSDSAAAKSTPLAAEHQPNQMWLPDATAESEDASSRPVRTHDTTFNAAAHLDQEERAEVMRRSPRDAILRARVRSAERKLGRQQVDPAPVPSAPDDDEGEDRVVARQDSVQVPSDTDTMEDTDRVIRQDTTPEPRQERPAPPLAATGDRLDTSPVPVAEVNNRQGRWSASKFNTIPEIKPDVELPRLRNQFRLPGQRGISRASSRSDDASGIPSAEPSAYDRALERAREFRTTNGINVVATAEEENPPVDVPIPAPTWEQRAANPGHDDGEDEVVGFQVDRSTRPGRFVEHTVEYMDEGDESRLEEDYELERSYRPATNANQSGHRWWHTFARHRVFRSSPTEESALRQLAQPGDDEWEPFDEVAQDTDLEVDVSSGDAFDIQWDSGSLASRAVRDDLFLSKSSVRTKPQSWSSFDFLEAEPDPSVLLEPLEWREEDLVSFDSPTPIEPEASESFDWDLSQSGGMDLLRDRLFGRLPRSSSPSGKSAMDRPKPGTLRAVQDVADGHFEFELPSSEIASSTDREIGNYRTSDDTPSVAYGYDSEFNPKFDLRRLSVSEIDPPLDMRIMISPEIPRMCATCRDFRPSENGSRGWCTNNWAFPHRPLVNAGDLACDSTIGCWWLPPDESWDEDAFYTRLEEHTPRTDRLESRLSGETRRIRRSM